MTVPNSFGAWEKSETRRYLDHVENYLLPLEDKVAELKAKPELSPDEELLLFALEEAEASGHEYRCELEATSRKVDRAKEGL